MESDASAENTATEREASPWRLAFDALRRSLWTRRSTDDALTSCGEESAPFPWPDLEMAEYEYARQLRDDEYGRRGLEGVVVVAELPRVSRADVGAVKGFLRDFALREGPGGAVDVYVPFDGASGSSKPVAFLALRDRGAAARVARALDGTLVDLPACSALNDGARAALRARPFGQRDGLLPPAAAGAPFSGPSDDDSEAPDSEPAPPPPRRAPRAPALSDVDSSDAGAEPRPRWATDAGAVRWATPAGPADDFDAAASSPCAERRFLRGGRPRGAGPRLAGEEPCVDAALDRLRGTAAPTLAALEDRLDDCVCRGDARRAARLDLHITRAYRAALGGHGADGAVHGLAAVDVGTADDDATDDTDARRRDVLAVVERVLRARHAVVARARRNEPPSPRDGGGSSTDDGDAFDDEAGGEGAATRLDVARDALRAERLRSASLLRALRASAARSVALAVDARERRDALASLGRRMDEVTSTARLLEDRCAAAERRADRAERGHRDRRRRRRGGGDDREAGAAARPGPGDDDGGDDDDDVPCETDREMYEGRLRGELSVFRAAAPSPRARRRPAPAPAAGGATSDDHEHETEPDDDDGPRAPLVVYRWDDDGGWRSVGEAHRPRRARSRSPRPFPNEYLCPITLGPMVDPCLCADGHSYERRAIAHWFASHSTSPLTNQRLDSKDVIPNHALRKAILRHTEQQAASA